MNYIGNEPVPSGILLVGDSTPVGMVGWFHAPPTGWAQLNGQTLAKIAFPDLWAYAQGFLTADQVLNPGLYFNVDGNNFKVPNLSGLFVRGVGAVDVAHTAAALGVKQADDNLSHLHLISRYNNPSANTGNIAGGGAPTGDVGAPDVKTSGGTEARPINVALVPCVKALKITLTPVTTEVGAYAPGTLVGFGMANNAVDAVNDIDVAAGKCRSSGDIGNIVGAALTKQLDAVWAFGNNAGMRASGAAIADTTYHLFAIRRPDTGQVDVAADTDVGGANIPANTNVNYTQRRRIGSILREAGTIVAFSQVGDEFLRKASKLDINLVNPGLAAFNLTFSVPLGVRLWVMAQYQLENAGAAVGFAIHLSELDRNDEPATQGGIALATLTRTAGTAAGAGIINWASVRPMRTNTAGQIRARAQSSDGNCKMFGIVLGWIDRRGQDDV